MSEVDEALASAEAPWATWEARTLAAEVRRLRAEEGATAALDAWSTMNEADRIFVRRYAPPLAAALDALARAHEHGEAVD